MGSLWNGAERSRGLWDGAAGTSLEAWVDEFDRVGLADSLAGANEWLEVSTERLSVGHGLIWRCLAVEERGRWKSMRCWAGCFIF